jgi:hypothetical protein
MNMSRNTVSDFSLCYAWGAMEVALRSNRNTLHLNPFDLLTTMLRVHWKRFRIIRVRPNAMFGWLRSFEGKELTSLSFPQVMENTGRSWAIYLRCRLDFWQMNSTRKNDQSWSLLNARRYGSCLCILFLSCCEVSILINHPVREYRVMLSKISPVIL